MWGRLGAGGSGSSTLGTTAAGDADGVGSSVDGAEVMVAKMSASWKRAAR